MKLTTPSPPADVLDVLPELRGRSKITVRLHPRQGAVDAIGASKIGGSFLWPENETWPSCPDLGPPDWYWQFGEDNPPQWWGDKPWLRDGNKHSLLVPVLQLRASDVPELEFFPGTNLFQLFWCPLDHDDPLYVAKPVVFWHDTNAITQPLRQMPLPPLTHSSYLPKECRLSFERVVEYPPIDELTEEQQGRLATWNIDHLLDETLDSPGTDYEWSLSVCPSMKIGGYVARVPQPEHPTCDCGRLMTHLLTIPDCEWDGGTYHRWMPIEEQHLWNGPTDERLAVQGAIGIWLGGSLCVFICRSCPTWPTRAIFRR